jgi:hypothetical protein
MCFKVLSSTDLWGQPLFMLSICRSKNKLHNEKIFNKWVKRSKLLAKNSNNNLKSITACG